MESRSETDAIEQLRLGYAGDELRRNALLDPTNVVAIAANNNYLVDQGDSPSSLVVGPLRFAHSVQNIQVFEERSVQAPKLTRSDKPMLLDGGRGEHKATIQLLFTGVNEEINIHLRALIALFKVAPIISVENEMIQNAWAPKRMDLLVLAKSKIRALAEKLGKEKQEQMNSLKGDIISKIKDGSFSEEYQNAIRNKFSDVDVRKDVSDVVSDLVMFKQNSRFVPVALESISVQTVPELPETLNVTLTIGRIDVSSATEVGVLMYLGPDSSGSGHANPKRAYWLKKFLKQLIDGNTAFLPQITNRAFGTLEFHFWNKTLANILPLADVPAPIILNTEEKTSKVEGQSCTLTNYFAYQRLIGKSVNCAHHMGTSARNMSMDIQHVDDDEMYAKLNQYKELSDALIRAESIYDRVMGWEVRSVTNLILGGSTSDTQETRFGVYSPLVIGTNTTDVPGLKQTSITLLETNTNFSAASELMIEEGGSSLDDQKDFFIGKKSGTELVGICPGERKNRKDFLVSNTKNSITGEAWEARAWRVFWPIGNSRHLTNVITSNNGVVNRDSFRAALLSKVFDKDIRLASALQKAPLFATVVRGETPMGLFDKLLYALSKESNIFSPPDLKSPNNRANALVASEVLRAVDRMFEGNQDLGKMAAAIKALDVDAIRNASLGLDEEQRTKITIARDVLEGLAGYPREIGSVILQLATNKDMNFSRDFKLALFDVMTRRPKVPRMLPHVYSQEGLFAAYTAFYGEYKFQREQYPGFGSASAGANNTRHNKPAWRTTTYRDFAFLPTYKDLFGDDWLEFAPTFDDLGLQYFHDRDITKSTSGQSLSSLQEQVAVFPDDKVPPHIWFYHHKNKSGIRDSLRTATEGQKGGGLLGAIDRLYLSMNLATVSDLKKVEGLQKNARLLEDIINHPEKLDPDGTGEVNEAVKTLVQVIREGYKREQDPNQSPVKTRRDQQYSVYYDKYFAENATHKLSIYFTSVGRAPRYKGEFVPTGNVDTKFQPTALLGAALVRVMHELQFTIDPKSAYGILPKDDEVQTAHGSDPHLAYARNHTKTIERTIKSSLAQVPDDFDSPRKLWPTAKVYFLERRGNDVVAEDVFFSTDSVISIDVTIDKKDAALAVIKVGDPLRYVQNAKFFDKHIVTVGATKESDGRRIVLGNQRGAQKSLLRSKKIEQGRPVMIKMGYDSVSSNLQTVFTGRITEIELGDVLTIVAQGWKAELINRQVNFYTSRKKNWGPKDLAVLAMQLADPDGFGEHFSEHEAQRILDIVKDRGLEDQLMHVVHQQEGTQNVHGTSSFFDWITMGLFAGDGFQNTFGTDRDKLWAGLDTRLKNVWYPDISKNINNWGNWRRFLGYPPDFTNDQWFVPLQPCWDVLNEAARHTWNYLVQVVPYDAEATLFFGHPDQMYFYTRGSNKKIAKWRAFANNKQKKAVEDFLLETGFAFLRSKQYGDNVFDIHKTQYDTIQLGISTKVKAVPRMTPVRTVADLVEFTPATDFLSLIKYSVSRNKAEKVDLVVGPGRGYRPIDRIITPSFSVVRKLSEFGINLEGNRLDDVTETVKDRVLGSGLPIASYDYLYNVYDSDPMPVIYGLLFGLDPSKLYKWNTFRTDNKALLSSHSNANHRESFRAASQNSIPLGELSAQINRPTTLAPENAESIIRDFIVPLRERLSGKRGTQEAPIRRFTHRQTPIPGPAPAAYILPEMNGLIEKIGSFNAANRIGNRLSNAVKELDGLIRRSRGRTWIAIEDKSRLRQALRLLGTIEYDMWRSVREHGEKSLIEGVIEEKFTIFSKGSLRAVPVFPNLPADTTVGDLLERYGHLIKAFVYFLAEYVKLNPADPKVAANFSDIDSTRFAPNMKTFRVHHYIDSDNDIIDNKIVASTARMWNTVVINRPAENIVDLSQADATQMNRGAQLKGSASWVYWPPTNISKVIGLQFHPGLTIANKKLRTFTELNCKSEPLSAKLACNRMAEGLRGMYMGHLTTRGRIIKPYDIVVLNDQFTGMTGPFEVESVVHHFNPDVGWVSNIAPCALAISNPGAAVVQTSLLEATYRARMQTAEWIFFVGMLVISAGSLTGAGAALGRTFFGKGAATALRNTLKFTTTKKGGVGYFQFVTNKMRAGMAAGRKSGQLVGTGPMAVASFLSRRYKLKRTAGRLIGAYLTEQTIKSISHHIGHHAMMNSWIEGNKDPEQLPVVLSPLMYNGAPWTAGVEADDILFRVPFSDFYYNFADAVTSISDAWELSTSTDA
jgi:hypothetical protein